MAAYREGKPRTSVAWEHFETKDLERNVATCKYCHASLSYRSSVTNLMKHLRRKHGYSVVKEGDDETNDDEIDAENEPKGDKSKIKNEVWEYFDIKDKENKLATCSLCLEQFSYSIGSTALTRHLLSKHSIDFGKGSDDDKDFKGSDDEENDADKIDVSLQNLSETKGRRHSSVAWDYFGIKDHNRKVASCNLCGALCSYRSSVSNLMKHVGRKHNIGTYSTKSDDGDEGLEGNDGTDDVEDSKIEELPSLQTLGTMTKAQRSIVWLYFKVVDSDAKVSQCLICKKLLSHSSTLTNLKKHLGRKHPNVKIPVKEDGRKRILLSSGGELYEVEAGTKLEDDDSMGNEDDDDNNQMGTVEMDTVYLEDFDALDEDRPKKRKLAKTTPKKRTRRYSSSSEDEITFINRYTKKHSDEFDHFGKYMATLLRKLPKETSSQLQADFVKQIMSVKDKVDEHVQEFVVLEDKFDK